MPKKVCTLGNSGKKILIRDDFFAEFYQKTTLVELFWSQVLIFSKLYGVVHAKSPGGHIPPLSRLRLMLMKYDGINVAIICIATLYLAE